VPFIREHHTIHTKQSEVIGGAAGGSRLEHFVDSIDHRHPYGIDGEIPHYQFSAFEIIIMEGVLIFQHHFIQIVLIQILIEI
jgi:hypothetical protein